MRESRLQLLLRRCAASTAPGRSLPAPAGPPPDGRPTHHLRQRCFSAQFPWLRPTFPLAFFSRLKPQEGGRLGQRGKIDVQRKERSPSIHARPRPRPACRRSRPRAAPRLPGGPRPPPYRCHRSEATEGGRGESPPPTHLPGPQALGLRWRTGRLCPRPRKPPAPPAAAEASQRLLVATAAAAAVAALLPRGSRSAPASRGARPTAGQGGGTAQHPTKVCGSQAERPKTLAPQVRFWLIVAARWGESGVRRKKGVGAYSSACCGSPCGVRSGRARPAPAGCSACVYLYVYCM